MTEAASSAAACWSAVAAEGMAGKTVCLGDGKAGTGEDTTAVLVVEAGLSGKLDTNEDKWPCCSVCNSAVVAAGSNCFVASRRPLTAADVVGSSCSNRSATEGGFGPPGSSNCGDSANLAAAEDAVSACSTAALQTLSVSATAGPSADRHAGRVATAAEVSPLAGAPAVAAQATVGITGPDSMADVFISADRWSPGLEDMTGSGCGGSEGVRKA